MDLAAQATPHLHRVAQPLAQLLVRAVNGKSPQEQHHAAFYLGECALRLVAAAAVAAWRAHPGADAALDARLAELVRPSMGHWAGIVREIRRRIEHPALGSAPGPGPAQALAEAMAAQRLLDRSEIGRAGKEGGFALLTRYRNDVIGHGAPRVRAFYQEMTPLILAASLAEVEAVAWLWAGDLLLAPDDAEGSWRRLGGLAALPTEAPLPAGSGLYAVTSAGPLSLHPLVVPGSDPALDRERVLFLNRAVVRRGRVKRAEYLDYATGETVLAPTGEALEAALLTPDLPDDSTDAQERVGDYAVGRVLGRGAMGVVHEAVQLGLGRRVAFKQLSEALADDPVARRRFEREVRALARCDHPNVAKVLAAGERDGVPYYVMELVEGANLADVSRALSPWLRAAPGSVSTGHLERAVRGPEPEPGEVPHLPGEAFFPRLASLFAGAAEGLHHLHQNGVVHRDVKPGNLMLTVDAERLVILDLGLARLDDASAGLTAVDDGLLGTLRYMAPEQLTGNRDAVGPRADVFALGASLYELATGRPRLDGDTRERLAHQLLHEPPPPARAACPAVPAALEAIVARATATDPGARYPDAAAFAEDLRAFAEGRAVSASPVAPPSAARRVPWGRVGLAAAGGVAALVALPPLVGLALIAGGPRTPPPPPKRALALEVEEVSALASVGYVDFAHDLRTYVVFDDGDVYLGDLDAPDSPRRNLTEAFEPYVNWASLSPDGRQVVLEVEQTLYLLAIGDASAAPRLLERRGAPCGWSPDGERFAFLVASPTTASGDAARADLHVRELAKGASAAWVPTVSGCSDWIDGSTLVAPTAAGVVEATASGTRKRDDRPAGSILGVANGRVVDLSTDLDAVELRLRERDRAPGPAPVLARLGGRLQDSSPFGGTPTAWVTTRTESRRWEVVEIDEDFRVVRRAWAPVPNDVIQVAMLPSRELLLVRVLGAGDASRTLAFSLYDAEDHDAVERTVFKTSLDGSLSSVGSSADGRTLYVWIAEGGAQRVASLSLDDGSLRDRFVPPAGVLDVAVSDDGARVAYTTDALEVIVVPADASDPAQALVEGRPRALRGWQGVSFLESGRVLVRDPRGANALWSPESGALEPIAFEGAVWGDEEGMLGVDEGRIVVVRPGKELRALDLPAPGPRTTLALAGGSEDGRTLLVARTEWEPHHYRVHLEDP